MRCLAGGSARRHRGTSPVPEQTRRADAVSQLSCRFLADWLRQRRKWAQSGNAGTPQGCRDAVETGKCESDVSSLLCSLQPSLERRVAGPTRREPATPPSDPQAAFPNAKSPPRKQARGIASSGASSCRRSEGRDHCTQEIWTDACTTSLGTANLFPSHASPRKLGGTQKNELHPHVGAHFSRHLPTSPHDYARTLTIHRHISYN